MKYLNLALFLTLSSLSSEAFSNEGGDDYAGDCNSVNVHVSIPGEKVGNYVGVSAFSAAKLDAYYFTKGEFDKPIIIIDGWSPEPINRCGEYLNHIKSILPYDLNDDGRDFVVVDIDDELDSVLANAAAVMKLLQIINGDIEYYGGSQTKVGDYSNAIIGFSMGGLIGRTALTFMEDKGWDHQTSLYMSYDSPHKYANSPAYLSRFSQKMAYLSEQTFGDNRHDASNDLYHIFWQNWPTKGMLATRPILFWYDDYSSFTYDNRNDDRLFETMDLETGKIYPDMLRKVAFSNGSDRGQQAAYHFDENHPIFSLYKKFVLFEFGPFEFEYVFNPIVPPVDSNLYNQYVECTNSSKWSGTDYDWGSITDIQKEDDGSRNPFKPIDDPCFLDVKFKVATGENKPYLIPKNPSPENYRFDEAPGSYSKNFRNGPIIEEVEDIVATANPFSFIPTISSVDYDTYDLFHNISADADPASHTPFDAVYFPGNGENEYHTNVTSEKVIQLRNEIFSYHVSQNGDQDGDGLTNKEEYTITGTDLNLFDTDGDGMNDGFEWHHGMNPVGKTAAEITNDRYGDLDYDGVSNFHEYCGSILGSDMDCVSAFSSDPTNPDSTPEKQRNIIVATIVTTNLLLM